jgi:hypothetical protein
MDFSLGGSNVRPSARFCLLLLLLVGAALTLLVGAALTGAGRSPGVAATATEQDSLSVEIKHDEAVSGTGAVSSSSPLRFLPFGGIQRQKTDLAKTHTTYFTTNTPPGDKETF